MCQERNAGGGLWWRAVIAAVLVAGVAPTATAQRPNPLEKTPTIGHKTSAAAEAPLLTRTSSSFDPAAENLELLRMAKELTADVNKTNKDVLSLDVIRKASAIEQYARKLQREMVPGRGIGGK